MKLLSGLMTLVGLTVGMQPALAQAPKVFKAGAFAMDITPLAFPIAVNGSMSNHFASGAHDRLHARCLVLDDGHNALAFVVCDSCMIPRTVMDPAKAAAAKATGIPVERILISATHAHSCPAVAGVFQTDDVPEYASFLTTKIAEGIQKAHELRRPAKIGWAVGQDPTQIFNRRWFMAADAVGENPFGQIGDRARMNPPPGDVKLVKPVGPIDPEVSILAVVGVDQAPIAVLANYSLHYVGGIPGGLLSADYFGQFAEQIKQRVSGGEGFVGIMSNGTSGDINNVNFFDQRPKTAKPPFEKIREVAGSVADAAYSAYRRIEWRDWASLDSRRTELELAVRKPTPDELTAAKKLLADNKPKLSDRKDIYARESVKLADFPDKVSAIIQTMRVGELAICSIPCEVFVEIGLELKKKSPFIPTFTVSLANGYNGYLPTPEQHALGGYETWRARSSYLEVGASPRIVQTLLSQLAELAAAKPK